MLIETSKHEVPITLEFLIRHFRVKEWEINPPKIQGSITSVKFLEAQQCGAHRDIPCKINNRLLHLAHPITKIKAQNLLGFYGL